MILLGAPWMTSSLVLNNQLRFQGSAAYAMVGITSGAVLNIGLDPLLIFVLDLGIAGAAWATIISQFVSFCLLLIGCTKGGNLQIHLSHVKLKPVLLSVDLQAAVCPSLARQGACQRGYHLPQSGGPDLRRRGHRRHGRGAADHDVRRLCHDRLRPGLSAGMRLQLRRRPVPPGDRRASGSASRSTFVLLLAVSAAGFACAPQLVSIFRDDPEVIAIGTAALRFQCVTFCLQSWVVMGNMCQQTMGLTVPATFMAVARQGLFFIPTVWILALTLGLPGIQMAQMVADLLTFLCSVPVQIWVLKKLSQPQK